MLRLCRRQTIKEKQGGNIDTRVRGSVTEGHREENSMCECAFMEDSTAWCVCVIGVLSAEACLIVWCGRKAKRYYR